MLQLDHKKHLLTYNNHSVELQPLSFRLLELLSQFSEQTVSTQTIIETVWANAAVSPETVKQRVFVLRKAIEKSNIQGITIQAVRGEGYRLLIEQPANKQTIGHYFKGKFLSAYSVAAAAFVSFVYFAAVFSSDFTVNNRVVVWTNIASEEMPLEGKNIYENWYSLLNDKNQQGELQLVYSDRVKEMLVPAQARKDRAGLISNFDLINIKNSPSVRFSIIEPTTATVLRSDLVSLSDKRQLQQTMQSHFNALSALIYSKALCLREEQRENSQAPVWNELRRIANQT